MDFMSNLFLKFRMQNNIYIIIYYKLILSLIDVKFSTNTLIFKYIYISY